MTDRDRERRERLRERERDAEIERQRERQRWREREGKRQRLREQAAVFRKSPVVIQLPPNPSSDAAAGSLSRLLPQHVPHACWPVPVPVLVAPAADREAKEHNSQETESCAVSTSTTGRNIHIDHTAADGTASAG